MEPQNFTVTQSGVEIECRITLDGATLIWSGTPLDEEEKPELPCAQPLAEFAEFGPPETAVYLQAPAAVLDELCAAAGVLDAPWRRPLAPEAACWFQAAASGDLAAMETALARGIDVNLRDWQRRSALWKAASARTLEPTRWLLGKGADPNLTDRYGRTLLMHAALLRDLERVELYLKHGADKRLRTPNGQTAFHIAVEAKAGGTLISAVHTYDTADWAEVAHVAANGGYASWLYNQDWYVAAHKPDINARARSGLTPIQTCLSGFSPHPLAVRWFVEQGADLTVVEEKTGSTLIHFAAIQNMPWCIAACVAAGVPIDARRADGRTALSLAVSSTERPLLVKALLQAGADPSLNQLPNAHPESALEQAIRLGLVWSAWLLQQKGHPSFSGLCCYAVLESPSREPNTWLEFPAVWCALRWPELQERLQKQVNQLNPAAWPRVLPFSEAVKQPWGLPGKQLLAVFPDESVQPVIRFRDERPRWMLSDPAAYTPGGIEEMRREWKWRAADWDGKFQNFSLHLKMGKLRWRGYNFEYETSVEQFRFEGPPQETDLDHSLPLEILDELCGVLGESERIWEAPVLPRGQRKKRLENWKQAELAVRKAEVLPPPLPHQSGRWCYAELEIEDRFNTRSGAGGDGRWTCWAEFPAEWAYAQRRFCQHWLESAIRRAYEVMNEKTREDPEGGTYILGRCSIRLLSLLEAKQQPWRERGKVLYLVTDRKEAPSTAAEAERTRLETLMADPKSPPCPVPISPPPLKPRTR